MRIRPRIRPFLTIRMTLIISLAITLLVASTRMRADMAMCGSAMTTLPFTDVPGANVFFCSIAEAYFSALTNGVTSTTYQPSTIVAREQMAAFITRTMDQSIKRGSPRSALNQYWTTQTANNLAQTTVGTNPTYLKSDGTDVWVANGDSTVSQVRARDGKFLGTWTSAFNASAVLCAMGKVFVTGKILGSSSLYQIDPQQAAGSVTSLTNMLGGAATAIAYDGQRIWTANEAGSVSLVTLNPTVVTTISTGFTSLRGVLYDGANIWVTDDIAGTVDKLRKLDSNGAILQSADVGSVPFYPAFDGTNIWVPNQESSTVSVVRATGGLAGTVLATLSGNGLNAPLTAAFDGERILVTNGSGHSVSLWKSTDFTPLGTFSTGASTFAACSDGVNFWITLLGTGKVARF